MEQIELAAVLRAEKGKEAVKKLRKNGQIPAVVYHRGEAPVSISLSNKEISHILRSAGGENGLINLTIEKEKKGDPFDPAQGRGEQSRTTKARSVIIKEVQQDPVRRSILHVDFNEISLTEKITVEVEVVAEGEPIGVKQEGGLLDRPLRELKIQCLPADIPKHIDVDVSHLKLNDSIHVKDLVLSDKLKVLNDPELLLFQVKLHVEEKAEEAVAEGTPEVEVIREKKEEEPKAGAEKEKVKEEPKAKEAVKPEKK